MKKLLTIFIVSFLTIGYSFVYAYSPQYGINSGLVGYWSFDTKNTIWTSETTGTTEDISGNGDVGTMTNMTKTLVKTLGKIGQGLKFDGVNDYVGTVSNPISSYASANSVCVWINPNDLSSSGGTYRTIVNFSADANNYTRLSVQSNGNITVGYTAGGVSYGRGAGGAPIKLNVWKYMCSVFNGSSLSIYVNGTQVDNVGDTASNGAVNYIGSRATIGYWSGSIDDVRVYNRALSNNEINQLYRQGLATYGK